MGNYPKIRKQRPLSERLWEKVAKGNSDDCWTWLGSFDSRGYGQFWHDKTVRRAHRVAFELEKGEIPNGLCVLHKCDNPLCCNPEHMRLGSQRDNMQDRYDKGRIRVYKDRTKI
jgi:hypothetical protein